MGRIRFGVSQREGIHGVSKILPGLIGDTEMPVHAGNRSQRIGHFAVVSIPRSRAVPHECTVIEQLRRLRIGSVEFPSAQLRLACGPHEALAENLVSRDASQVDVYVFPAISDDVAPAITP